jgi:hypothetical protein
MSSLCQSNTDDDHLEEEEEDEEEESDAATVRVSNARNPRRVSFAFPLVVSCIHTVVLRLLPPRWRRCRCFLEESRPCFPRQLGAFSNVLAVSQQTVTHSFTHEFALIQTGPRPSLKIDHLCWLSWCHEHAFFDGSGFAGRDPGESSSGR